MRRADGLLLSGSYSIDRCGCMSADATDGHPHPNQPKICRLLLARTSSGTSRDGIINMCFTSSRYGWAASVRAAGIAAQAIGRTMSFGLFTGRARAAVRPNIVVRMSAAGPLLYISKGEDPTRGRVQSTHRIAFYNLRSKDCVTFQKGDMEMWG